jgi:hypothetical protein
MKYGALMFSLKTNVDKKWWAIGVMSALMFMSFGAHAFTDLSNSGCDPISAQEATDNANAALEEAKADNQKKKDAIGQIKPPGGLSCLDNMNITMQMGLPTLGGVMDGIINAVKGKVCSEVTGAIGQVSGAVNRSVSYPGIPGVSGTSSSGGIYVGGPGGAVVNGKSQQVFQKMVPTNTPAQTQAENSWFNRLKQSLGSVF